MLCEMVTLEIYSTSKALFHLDRLQELKKGNPIAPSLIQIDLEAWCNHNCSFCSYRKEDGYNKNMLKLIDGCSSDECKPIGRASEKSRLPRTIAETLPKQMRQSGVPAIELTGGGEPTMWPYFDELLSNLILNGIEIGLVTNGSNLPEKRIRHLAEYNKTLWVRFSMDASNQDIHKKIHRTSKDEFEKIIKSLKQMVQYKHDNLVIGVSFIITPDNYLDIEDSILLYKKIGVDNIRFSWMYDTTGTAHFTKETIEEIKNNLESLKNTHDTDNFRVLFERGRIETYDRPNDDFKTCYYQRFVWNIGADGFVYPCCIQKYNPDYALADITVNTVKEIIQLTHSRMTTLNPIMCNPCWLRNRNKTISQSLEEPKHVNFV